MLFARMNQVMDQSHPRPGGEPDQSKVHEDCQRVVIGMDIVRRGRHQKCRPPVRQGLRQLMERTVLGMQERGRRPLVRQTEEMGVTV